MRSVRTFIGLGSNAGNPARQLEMAIVSLDEIPDTRLRRLSSIYLTRPMGPKNQPDYLNAVAELETGLEADRLLGELQAIENKQGRVRDGERWGERTIDLDILLYGNAIINTDKLVVPHPGMHERGFVLYPLQELEADIEIPDKGDINTLLQNDLVGDVVERLEVTI